jgi:hypothetical protein
MRPEDHDSSPGGVAHEDATATGPVTAWSGWDVRGGATAGAAQALAHSRHSGTEEAYEFLAVAARGFRPPRFLRTVDLPGTGHDDPEEESREGLRLTWSLLYRRVAETGPAVVAPYAIYLLGVNPPPDTTEAELDVFNDFYTNVHMPEVAERRHALRAVRYALLRQIRPPYQGAPQFLAVYEVDETGASNRRHTGPPYSAGPEVWQRHTTPWRLWYRRLTAEDGTP